MALNHFDAMLAAETKSRSASLDRDERGCGTPNCAWREKVSQWCYDVADHLDEDRSIVYVAMTILDRYCTTLSTPIDEKQYEISSLSSIFLAVHIAGSGDLTLKELVSMSRGGVAIKDIIGEATTIADAITLSEPILTPVDFVRSAIQHITPLNVSVHKQALLDSASYMIELAVFDSFFSNRKASFVAVAALLNALEIVLVPNSKAIVQSLIKESSLTVDSIGNIMLHRTRLQCIYNHSFDYQHDAGGPHIIEADDDDDDVDAVCPFATSSTLVVKRDYSTFITDDESVSPKRSKMEM